MYGDWNIGEGVSLISSLRLEYLFYIVLHRLFPMNILTDLLAWDLADVQGTDLAMRNLLGVTLGILDLERRSRFKNARISVIIKMHQPKIEDRNVVRLFNNGFTMARRLLRRMMVHLLEEGKNK